MFYSYPWLKSSRKPLQLSDQAERAAEGARARGEHYVAQLLGRAAQGLGDEDKFVTPKERDFRFKRAAIFCITGHNGDQHVRGRVGFVARVIAKVFAKVCSTFGYSALIMKKTNKEWA